MSRFHRSEEFKKRLQKKPPHEQAAVLKSLKFLAMSRNHPSLNIHPLKGVRTDDGRPIYDGWVTRKLRITFDLATDGTINLRTNCQHDKVLRSP